MAGCAWTEARQRELIYRPTPGRPADFVGLREGDRIYRVDVPGAAADRPDHLQLWWLPNADPQAPTLLYLHGTFRNLFQNLRKIEALRDAGFGVVAVDYRGWGESSAVLPSESSINADAAIAWHELIQHQPDPNKRVLFGHSLGGGVAVELASRLHFRRDYGALILESTFTRLPDLAQSAGVLGAMASWFTTQEFNSIAKISHIDAPILMMHGTQDKTVPLALGKTLYLSAPAGNRWVEFPGGSHSGLDREAPELYRQSLRQLIAQLPTS